MVRTRNHENEHKKTIRVINASWEKPKVQEAGIIMKSKMWSTKRGKY